jgi:sugar lactone lactonase YvrE
MLLRRHFLAALPLFAARDIAPRRNVRAQRAFDAPCQRPNGMQATPEGLWVLNQGFDNALYLIDHNGKLKEKLPTESVNGSGVGWDGVNLWVASTYSAKILKVDRKSGRTLAAYDTPGAGVVNWPNPRRSPLAPPEPPKPPTPVAKAPATPRQVTGAHGIEYRDGKLYVAVPPSATIYRINPAGFQVEHSFKTAGDRPHGLGWEGPYLWCADSNLNAFHKYDPATGKVLELIQLADSDPLPHGMTIWNGVMWYCDDVGVICKIKL